MPRHWGSRATVKANELQANVEAILPLSQRACSDVSREHVYARSSEKRGKRSGGRKAGTIGANPATSNVPVGNSGISPENPSTGPIVLGDFDEWSPSHDLRP